MQPTDACVLVVDDEEALRTFIHDKVSEIQGVKVVGCGSPKEAIRLCTNQRFSCILLDINLGEGTGEDVLQHVRGNPQGFNYTTPVLAMSGHLSREVMERISPLINGALVKPFQQHDLVDRIRTLVAPARPAA